MGDFINIILSNTFYIIITVCISGAIVYFIVKKMTKLYVLALILLIAFLTYAYYTGQSVQDTLEKAQETAKDLK
jgi:hypothetical protein